MTSADEVETAKIDLADAEQELVDAQAALVGGDRHCVECADQPATSEPRPRPRRSFRRPRSSASSRPRTTSPSRRGDHGRDPAGRGDRRYNSAALALQIAWLDVLTTPSASPTSSRPRPSSSSPPTRRRCRPICNGRLRPGSDRRYLRSDDGRRRRSSSRPTATCPRRGSSTRRPPRRSRTSWQRPRHCKRQPPVDATAPPDDPHVDRVLVRPDRRRVDRELTQAPEGLPDRARCRADGRRRRGDDGRLPAGSRRAVRRRRPLRRRPRADCSRRRRPSSPLPPVRGDRRSSPTPLSARSSPPPTA